MAAAAKASGERDADGPAPRGEAGAVCPRGVQETRAGGKAQAGVAKRRGRSSHLSPAAVGGTQDEIRSVRSFKRENKV